MKIGCPLYPVGMIGTREIQPPDAKVPKLGGACTIKIGRPINVERYRNRTDVHLVLRQITDELMFEIRELTGQDYRNAYAGKTAETEPTVVAKVANMTVQPPELVGAAAGK
jgi:1-acyl-sn-glycerol-3-phosphate acyltransferase